jgi:hypothetical protein
VERLSLLRQPPDHAQQLASQLLLQGPQIGLGLHLCEALPPRGVEGPRALDLVVR